MKHINIAVLELSMTVTALNVLIEYLVNGRCGFGRVTYRNYVFGMCHNTFMTFIKSPNLSMHRCFLKSTRYSYK